MRQSPSGSFQAIVRAQETANDIVVTANTPFAPALSAAVPVSPIGGIINARASISGQFAGADPLNSIRYRYEATLLTDAGNPTSTVIFVPGAATIENDTIEIISLTYLRLIDIPESGSWRVQLLMRAVGTNFTINANTLPNGNHALLELIADGSGQTLTDVENGV